MSSEAQIVANKKNALRSTGPQIPDGKVKASKNSIKHGLLSRDLLINSEKRSDLEAFRQKLYFTLCPQGIIEELLVERIINSIWRLRRVTLIENAVFCRDDVYCGASSIEEAFSGSERECMQSLSRYESNLERAFYKAVHELQRLQAMRLGYPVLAPITVEVNGL